MNIKELNHCVDEELWCASNLCHKDFYIHNAVIEVYCDEFVDEHENHKKAIIKNSVDKLIKGKQYYNWCNQEDGVLDPICHICRSESFRIHYFSSLGGMDKLTSILVANLENTDSKEVKWFIKSLVYWFDRESKYRVPPFCNENKNEIISILD